MRNSAEVQGTFSTTPSPPPAPPEDDTPEPSRETKTPTPPQAPVADDFNDDDSGTETTYVPSGKITGEVRGYLDDLRAKLSAMVTEPDIIEAFDAEDIQTKYADNELAMSEAFKLRNEIIAALATKARKDLEQQGQGSMFGDEPGVRDGH